MSQEKVITTCHWRRPDYSAKCMEYLSRCHGIKDYTVICQIDGGGDKKVPDACLKLKPHVKKLVLQQSEIHRGCNVTTLTALESGFALADYVIHVEDDILVARDALLYCEWARQFEKDSKLYTIGLWRHNNGWMPSQNRPWIPGHERFAAHCHFFHAWGWATWASRWQGIRKGWTTGTDQSLSWDIVMPKGELIPYISRANNIGSALGTHRGDCWLDHWADSPGFVEPGKFERVG